MYVFNDRVVSHENISKVDHCTISKKGVTRMRSDDETEFVTLDRWEQEYELFKKIIEVLNRKIMTKLNLDHPVVLLQTRKTGLKMYPQWSVEER